LKTSYRSTGILGSFFGVALERQTYRSGAYLLLAFPLGIVYGAFLITGWYLGYGLLLGAWQSLSLVPDPGSRIKIGAVAIGGVLVWLLVLGTCWLPACAERYLARWFLGTGFSSPLCRLPQRRGVWAWMWAYLSDPVTWKSLVFVALKLPLGIAAFTVVIGLLSAASGLLFAPLARLAGFESLIIGPWRIDTWAEAFLASALALFVVPLSLHVLNGLAVALGWFARVMLDGSIRKRQRQED